MPGTGGGAQSQPSSHTAGQPHRLGRFWACRQDSCRAPGRGVQKPPGGAALSPAAPTSTAKAAFLNTFLTRVHASLPEQVPDPSPSCQPDVMPSTQLASLLNTGTSGWRLHHQRGFLPQGVGH